MLDFKHLKWDIIKVYWKCVYKINYKSINWNKINKTFIMVYLIPSNLFKNSDCRNIL